jgi:hypothetical protein
MAEQKKIDSGGIAGSLCRSCRWACIVALGFLVAGGIVACGSSQDKGQSHTKIGQPVDAKLIGALQSVANGSLKDKAATGHSALHSIDGPKLKTDKQGVLYIGADFCPNCASFRWPLIVALLRFGRFNGLEYMRSSSEDAFPDTVTFSLEHARFHSDYLAFQAVDIADRAGQPLERPDKHQLAIFRQFDAAPYTHVAGAVPFFYVGGRYLEIGTPLSPKLLTSQSWEEVVSKLQNGQSSLRQQVLKLANLYTAAFCKITKRRPENVCSSPAVVAADSVSVDLLE